MSIIHSEAQYKRQSRSVEQRKNNWIDAVNKIHNFKYDYSKISFKSQTQKIEIVCPYHGSFYQRPCDHKNQKQGCPKCSHNQPLSHDDFCIKSTKKFADRFFIKSKFKGIKHPITIVCKDHGEFTLKYAENHLRKDGGCPKCWYETRLSNLKPGNISKKETEWLDSLNVPIRQHKLIINGNTYLVDGFDPSTNTVYEYYGSFWHGNPEMYNSADINSVLNKSFGELYEKTLERENQISEYHNFVCRWD